MTEQEWIDCISPDQMLEFMGGKVTARKMRLYACACCRLVWHRLHDERSRQAVEAAERYTDGLISHADLKRAWVGASEAFRSGAVSQTGQGAAAKAAMYAADPARSGVAQTSGAVIQAAWYDRAAKGTVYSRQADLLRELLGNPFQPVNQDQPWLVRDAEGIARLARGIYNERAWQDLPILGDALEEAGCPDEHLLSHVRSPGPHVLGCWVVDALIGLT